MITSKKVNLGCGDDVREGWCNLDLNDQADIKWDLRNGLPPECTDLTNLYSSHCLEHLEDAESLALLKVCYERLVPGGVLRLCLPDAFACMKHFVEGDMDYFLPVAGIYNIGMNPETASPIDYISFLNYQFKEHVAVYDNRKARKFLEVAGFKDIQDCEHDPEKDGTNGMRRHFSFYMEAVK